MGDSPSLSFVPAFNESYDEGIYQQFAEFAWVVRIMFMKTVKFIELGVVATKVLTLYSASGRQAAKSLPSREVKY